MAGLAWLVILGVAGFIFASHNYPEQVGAVFDQMLGAPEEAEEAPVVESVAAPSMQISFAGRYAVGASSLLPGGSGVDLLVGQVEDVAIGKADDVRAAIVAGEMNGGEDAIDRLLAINLEENGSEAEGDAAPVDVALAGDIDALLALYSDGQTALSDAQRDGLIERHGWFGELAVSYGADEATSTLRADVMSSARRLVVVVVSGFTIGAIAFVAGFVIFIIAIVRIGSGKMRWAYSRPAPGGSVLLECFALFLIAFIGVQFLSGWVTQMSGGIDVSTVLVWLLALCPLWALVRGIDKQAWKFAIGWHTGSGVFKEIGAGVLGYLAGLPVLAGGVALTFVLMWLSALLAPENGEIAPPTHPLGDEIMAGGFWGLVGLFSLATVWAPIVEETMFRGALYHHLRGRIGMLTSAVAVAFIFAAIHPQGWLAIPALGSLAIVFAMIREWRGSIIAPAVAHAINNGFIFTLLVLALS